MEERTKVKIERIVEEYTDLLVTDKAPSFDEYLKRYPELETELRPQLETVLLLNTTCKSISPIPETLKQKLAKQYWLNIQLVEKKHLLMAKKGLMKTAMFPVKKGIDFLLLFLFAPGKTKHKLDKV